MIEISGEADDHSQIEDFKSSGSNGSRAVTFASDRIQPPQPRATLPSRPSFSSMKRGFTNLISSVDAALKHTPLTPTGGNNQMLLSFATIVVDRCFELDEFDTLSVRSDGSSDSENFVVLHGEHGEHAQHDGFAVFRTGKVSVATPSATVDSALDAAAELEEAFEVRADTPTNSEPSSAGPAATVSYNPPVLNRETAVVTFHINDLELINQAVGSTSSLRLQAGHLSCSECIAITREEFQVECPPPLLSGRLVDTSFLLLGQVRLAEQGLARSSSGSGQPERNNRGAHPREDGAEDGFRSGPHRIEWLHQGRGCRLDGRLDRGKPRPPQLVAAPQLRNGPDSVR